MSRQDQGSGVSQLARETRGKGKRKAVVYHIDSMYAWMTNPKGEVEDYCIRLRDDMTDYAIAQRVAAVIEMDKSNYVQRVHEINERDRYIRTSTVNGLARCYYYDIYSA